MVLHKPDNLSKIVRVFTQNQWQSSFIYLPSFILRHFGLGPKGLILFVCLCGKLFPPFFSFNFLTTNQLGLRCLRFCGFTTAQINDNDHPRNSQRSIHYSGSQ